MSPEDNSKTKLMSDVKRPGKSVPSPTSRDIIVSNKAATDDVVRWADPPGPPALPGHQNGDANSDKVPESTDSPGDSSLANPEIDARNQDINGIKNAVYSQSNDIKLHAPADVSVEEEEEEPARNTVSENAAPEKDKTPPNHSAGTDHQTTTPVVRKEATRNPDQEEPRSGVKVIPAAHPEKNIIHFYSFRRGFRWFLMAAIVVLAVIIILDYFQVIDIGLI